MRHPTPELLLESLAEALQTMAFICPEPSTEDVAPPDSAVCLSIRWAGANGGELQLASSKAFGELLAVNILALEAGTPEAAQHAVDALQELCNITAGGLLVRLSDSSDDSPEMGLPTATVLADGAEWRRHIALPNTTVLLAEGYPLAIRFQESPL